MKRIVFIIVFIVLATSVIVAQKFTAQVSKSKLAVGETFQITYSLNTNGSGFKAPPLFDFDVYGGPNQSQSVSIVNGNMSQTISWSFILAPKKEGKFTIAPATINVGGDKIESNSIAIEVVKGAANSGNQNNNPNITSPSTTENIGDNLFARTVVNKSKVYQGEQISVTHKIYTRYQLRGFQDVKFPDYTGFWSQDVPTNNQQVQITTENVDGVNYYVAELKRTYIFPQRSGKIQIEPIEVEAVVRKKSNKQPRDIFEQMFGGGYEDAVYSVKSSPIVIDVAPLPIEKKPTDYTGAVGDYSFTAQISKEKVKANEAINLTITLNGKGNIKLVEAPKVNFPEEFEVYDPKNSEKIATTGAGVMGSKTFDYLIIPRHEGNYKIDKINFTYFDPQKKEYITLPSPEFLIEVAKADPSSNASVYTPKSKDDVKVLSEDIRFIKTKTNLERSDDLFFGSVAFYSALLSPLLGFLLFLFIRRKNINDNKDVVAVKSRRATKLAKKQLAIAEKHLKLNEKEKFYIEISKALFDYISNKFNLNLSELNRDNINRLFIENNIQEQTVKQFMDTLDKCEFAKYAPSSSDSDLNTLYENTVSLITKIENELK